MADKTTSTTELQTIAAPANMILEITDGNKTQNKDKIGEAELSSCLLPFFQTLSLDAKNNILSLRHLQKEQVEHEVNYYKEIHALELKYEKIYEEIFKRRREIIMGLEKRNSDTNLEDKAKGNNISSDDSSADGLNKFWLTVFLNSNTLSKQIFTGDEAILKHLTDVTSRYYPEGSLNFILEFHFEPNQYFTNSVLTKEYEVKGTPDEQDLFNYDGPNIVKCKGCTINWKEDKNPTVKIIRKKKQKGVKTVKRKSFFNFFNPPVESQEGDIDEDIDEILTYDFEIGDYIKERIIPRAIAYYTKEADFGSEDSEEEDSDSESSEDHEKNQRHQPRSRRKAH